VSGTAGRQGRGQGRRAVHHHPEGLGEINHLPAGGEKNMDMSKFKDNEFLLIEKVLKHDLKEQTERLKIVFDMMISKEEEDFNFDKNSYLNFIKRKIIEGDDHIEALKKLSKICNFNLEEEIAILKEQINIIEKEKQAMEKRSLFKIVN